MRALLLGLAISVLTASAAAAKEADPLTLPLSPGSVALLIERAKEPAVQERWAAALKHPDSQVRAAAARVVGVAGVKDVVPAIRASLLRETDGDAAAEEAWALSALDPTSDPAILEAISRAQAQRGQVLAAFARGAAPRFFALIPKLRSLRLSAREWRPLLESVRDSAPTQFLAVAPAALRENDEAFWLALLRAATPEAPIAPGRLQLAATQSPSAAIRTATCLDIAHGIASGRSVTFSLEGAVPAADPLEIFAREILSRWLGHSPVALPATLFASLGERREDLGRWTGGHALAELARKLDGTERNLLAATLGMEAQRLVQQPLPPEHGAPEKPGEQARGHGMVLPEARLTTRTAGPFPRGFVADLLSVTGCKGDSGKVASAITRFDAGGRPVQVQLQMPPLSDGCARAARTLLLSTVRLSGDTADTQIALPLEKEFFACMAEAPSQERPEQSAGEDKRADPFAPGVIQEPKRVRNVNPIYPDDARRERVQGTVILEGWISPWGCVQSLKLLRAIHPSINTAAFLAVSQWAYTPTLFNGRPVPVIMTVTVNFKLN